MSNKEILQEIMNLFGKEDAVLFCRMEAHKYKIRLEEAKKNRSDREDLGFDVEWWENKYQELLNN
jgi:hypothetical protein